MMYYVCIIPHYHFIPQLFALVIKARADMLRNVNVAETGNEFILLRVKLFKLIAKIN